MHFRAAKKANGVEYYQYCVCYVDDILVCGEDPKAQMDEISGKFTLKDGTVEEPKMYLGANIVKTEVIDNSGNKFHVGASCCLITLPRQLQRLRGPLIQKSVDMFICQRRKSLHLCHLGTVWSWI